MPRDRAITPSASGRIAGSPSSRTALRNAATSSLELTSNDGSHSIHSLFIVTPPRLVDLLGEFNVLRLRRLRASNEQQEEGCAFKGDIGAISSSEMKSQLEYSIAYRFPIPRQCPIVLDLKDPRIDTRDHIAIPERRRPFLITRRFDNPRSCSPLIVSYRILMSRRNLRSKAISDLETVLDSSS